MFPILTSERHSFFEDGLVVDCTFSGMPRFVCKAEFNFAKFNPLSPGWCSNLDVIGRHWPSLVLVRSRFWKNTSIRWYRHFIFFRKPWFLSKKQSNVSLPNNPPGRFPGSVTEILPTYVIGAITSIVPMLMVHWQDGSFFWCKVSFLS